ncbi:MAG: Ig-like domain-containing protein [Caulobacter sp.]
MSFRYTVQSGDFDANGITVGNLQLNGGSIRDKATNSAALTLNNVPATADVLVDATPSVASIERWPGAAAVTNATNVVYVVTFDQPVTGVDAGDFVLTPVSGSATGSISGISGSGGVYNVTVTGVSGDGPLRLDLKGSGTGIQNAGALAIAGGYTAGQTYNFDHTAPAVSSVSAPPAGTYKAGQDLDFVVTFTEQVTVTGAPSLGFTLGSTSRQATLVNSDFFTATFRYTIQDGDLDTDGFTFAHALSLNGSTIRDGAGNNATLALNSVASTSGVKVDAVKPTATILSVKFSVDTGSSATDLVTKEANQTVSGKLSHALNPDERVEISFNGGTTWFIASSTNDDWSINVGISGSNTLMVKVVDDAGNEGDLFSRAWALDTTLPTATATTAKLSVDTGWSETDFITKTAAQSLSGDLSTALNAGDYVQVSLDNGQSWTTASVSGTAWTLAGVTLAGSGVLQVRVSNLAGNTSTPVIQAYTLDTTSPTTTGATVSFSADSGASQTDLVTKTASQTLTGTLDANLSPGERVEVSTDGGSTWSIASASANSSVWSLSAVTLTQSDAIQVRVADTAGNTGGVYSATYVYDDEAPSAAITSSVAGGLQAGQSATLTFTFSEVPYGFSLADVSSSSGSLTALAATADPRVFTAEFTASNATASVTLNAGSYQDVAGNSGVASQLSLAWTPPPAPQPDPEPALTAPQIREIFASAAGFAPNSAKALASNITLPDGSVVPNPAFEAAAKLATLIARFEAGSITRDALIDGVVELSAPTSAVALQAYQFFTGATPTQGGMGWLIDSPNNANDLTDPYYARFNEVNRFINFAVNLGVQGEGRAAFEAKFGALDFAASVRLAYDMVIGLDAARAAGINVDAALSWIASQEGYFDAFAGSDLGGKAAMIGYVMQAGFEAKVGRYYEATHNFIEAGFDGSAPYHVDLVGGQHLGSLAT